MEENKKPMEMTEKQYYEMRLQEITTTQLMFNKECANNLKLLSDNASLLLERIQKLEKKLNETRL